MVESRRLDNSFLVPLVLCDCRAVQRSMQIVTTTKTSPAAICYGKFQEELQEVRLQQNVSELVPASSSSSTAAGGEGATMEVGGDSESDEGGEGAGYCGSGNDTDDTGDRDGDEHLVEDEHATSHSRSTATKGKGKGRAKEVAEDIPNPRDSVGKGAGQGKEKVNKRKGHAGGGGGVVNLKAMAAKRGMLLTSAPDEKVRECM